jgi:effector-binding domain-containing protein
MHDIDVIVKVSEPVRMAETIGVAPTYGYANVHPVFEERLPTVWNRLLEAGVRPGMHLAYFEWPEDDGRIAVHMGFEIGDQRLEDTDEVRTVELPSVEVAAAIHRGPLTDFTDTFQETVRWIETSGYHIAGCSRELYLAWDPHDPSKQVTELQMPIARAVS